MGDGNGGAFCGAETVGIVWGTDDAAGRCGGLDSSLWAVGYPARRRGRRHVGARPGGERVLALPPRPPWE